MRSPSDKPTLYQPIDSIETLESGDRVCDVAAGAHRTVDAVETDSILFADGKRVPHMTVIISMVQLRSPEQLWEVPDSVTGQSSNPTTMTPDSPGLEKPRYSGDS